MRKKEEAGKPRIVNFLWSDTGEKPAPVSAAPIFGREFYKIAEEQELTADVVIEKATPEGSPLHSYFEWDNTIAAHKYRKVQANRYIRRLEVVIDVGGNHVQTKSFVSIILGVEDDTRDSSARPSSAAGENARKYVTVLRMRDDPTVREQVRQEAIKALRAWADRYRKLGFEEEFAPILKIVDELTK